MISFNKEECEEIIKEIYKEQEEFFNNLNYPLKMNFIEDKLSSISMEHNNYKMFIFYHEKLNDYRFFFEHKEKEYCFPLGSISCNNIDFISDIIYSKKFNVKNSPYVNKNELVKIIKESPKKKPEVFNDNIEDKIKKDLINVLDIMKEIKENKLMKLDLKSEYDIFFSLREMVNNYLTCDFNINNNLYVVEQLELLKLSTDMDLKKMIEHFGKNKKKFKLQNS